MSKKNILFFIFALFISFVFTVVDAKVIDYSNYVMPVASTGAKITSARVEDSNNAGDVIVVRTSGTVFGYYINTQNNFNTAKYYASTSNVYYFSVRNGTYYIWIYGNNAAGVPSKISGGSVNVTTSCSNQTLTNQTGSGTVQPDSGSGILLRRALCK